MTADHRTERRGSRALRPLTIAAALGVGLALLVALLSPEEATMGPRVRLLYVHVGAAWTTYLAFGLMALSAVMYLWRRERRWDRMALACAEVGVVLTSVTLVTGSLWGHSVNGWWWDWGDLRLVLTLLLWFIYAAYLVLRSFTEGETRAVLSAVVAVAGVPTMVLNHFAVRLSQRSHPPSVLLREGGPSADQAIFRAAVVSFIAYTIVFAALIVARVLLESQRDRLAAIRRSEAGYQP